MMMTVMTQAGFLAESLFRVFDEDNSGALSFYEFAQVLVVIVCHCLSLFVCTGARCHCLFAQVVLVQMIRILTMY